MRPEILSPAGTPEKLRAAIAFGADAVYLAGNCFGMRAAAGNFTNEELIEAVEYAHKRNVKVHVTVNTMPRTKEYEYLPTYLKFLYEIGVDALIISDLGVFTMAREVIPNMVLHVSTQASVVSAETCKAWYKLGAKRVVLARELSLEEIIEIRKNIPEDLEIETFVHGSMCVSYSGRCLLSNYLTGRDANRGACAQPCRWDYKLYNGEFEEIKRKGERFVMVEEGPETFTFSSRDLCMIEHIPELVEAGIACFKIEGRMKSASYTATVTNTYKEALDLYLKDKENYKVNPEWMKELESVCHRQYCTGFFFGDYIDNSNICTEPGYIHEQAALALSISYDKETQMCEFYQKNKFSKGDKIELLLPGKRAYVMIADQIFDSKGNEIENTPHPMMKFKLKIPFEVPEYSILRYALKENE